MGKAELPSVTSLGWNQRQYDAVGAAYQTYFRGRPPRESDHEISTVAQLEDALATARKWQVVYENALVSGELRDPGNDHLLGKWEITPSLRTNFGALLRLNRAVQRRLIIRLTEMAR